MADMAELILPLSSIPFAKFDRDLWKVLVDTWRFGTQVGEILKHLENQDPDIGGESGFEAFRKIDKRLNEHRTVDILALRERVMNLERPKHKEEVL